MTLSIRVGVLLALLPLGWTFFAGLLSGRNRLADRIAVGSGIGLAVLIAIIFTIAILRPVG